MDRAITAVDPAATSRETFYVGMTRGKHSNTAVLAKPEAADDAPDPWQMIREITPTTAREQLTRVLDRSDTELTAHEVRDHAHGWDADLPRLADELRYVGAAIATREAVDWVRTTHGPDAVTSWANTDHWNAIINELARGRQLPETPAQTPRQALAEIKAMPQHPRQTRDGGLAVPPAQTPAEIETVEQVFTKISDRLAVLRAQTRDEPWRTRNGPQPTERINAALLARQLCNWDDPYAVLPPEPPRDPRAAEAWKAFHATTPDLVSEAADETQVLRSSITSTPRVEDVAPVEHHGPHMS